ncbi:MAG TPA: plasmid maintenance protein CcdB [Thauera sp.]|nr:plasmid maintenance protein CcdB [Thauera sp.]HHW66004.1 plasmid maintenance protein CcdB [Rhodocyclaceae bacterium]
MGKQGRVSCVALWAKDGMRRSLCAHIPLRCLERFPKVSLPARLTPVLTVEGMDCFLETPKMGAVPLRVLKSPVTSLAHAQEQVNAALDFLFQGY